MTNCFAPHLLCTLQTSNSDQHPLLDRTASQRPFAVAGQGPHTDGLSQHPLLQCVIGVAHAFRHPLSHPNTYTQTMRKTQVSLSDDEGRDAIQQINKSLSSLAITNISPHICSTFLSTI